MSTWSFAEKTVFNGYSDHAQEDTILATLQTIYDGSSTARTMFHNWIEAGNIITFNNVSGALSGYTVGTNGTGIMDVDINAVIGASYIDPNGTVAPDTLVTAIAHELGHALTGRKDTTAGGASLDYNSPDYKGDNVIYVNPIFKELGKAEQVSYIAYDSNLGVHKPVGYKYINGTPIDVAVTMIGPVDYSTSGNWNSANAANTRDLLIGDSRANSFESGGGNDFLVGGGGNDRLEGGADKDTAVYFGKPTDYDIRINSAGTEWTVKHERGDKDEGVDTLLNVEKIQFGTKTYDLKKQGLTFQDDFALVIDTTGSMGSSIGAVKSNATALIDDLFASDTIDARIGVVGFKDTTNGEPSSVILPFSDKPAFADRRAEALAAINSITVGGGGDIPETPFNGLLTALAMDWRPGAAVHRLVLFTDASAKDSSLSAQVAALASNLGATITAGGRAVGVGGTLESYDLTYDAARSGAARSVFDDGSDGVGPSPPLVNNPGTPDTSKARLEIYTIAVSGTELDPSLASIASATGGKALAVETPDDLVNALLKIIEAPPSGSGPGSAQFVRNDFNGDAKSDILWQNDGGQVFAYLMDGTSLLAGGQIGDNRSPEWKIKGTGDFNGDSKSDILFQSDAGQAYLWLMDGLSIVDQGFAHQNSDPSWHVVGSGDFNGDAKSDILWQNDNGEVYSYLMDGTSLLAGGQIGDNRSPEWKIKGTGDFNGDSKSDILFQSDAGQTYLWLMDGLSIVDQGFAHQNSDPSWHVVGSGDFNGDAKSDILWQNDNGQVYAYLMDGTSLVAGGPIGDNRSPEWTIKGTGDLNGDSKSDIIFQSDAGQSYYWLVNGLSIVGQGFAGSNVDPSWHVVGGESHPLRA